MLLALDPLRAKIADLGEARFKTSTDYMTMVGTPVYTAPEVLSGDNKYDERVDVYAAGVVLRCVHAGDDRPWPVSKSNFDIFAAVQRGERPWPTEQELKYG